MEHDFWIYVFLECDIKNITNFRLICKNAKIKIDDEYFWKNMIHRDFIDIHKLNEDTWFSYYKRRSINYGVPVIIDKEENFVNIQNTNETLYKGSHKCIYGVLKNNILRCLYNPDNLRIYILSTEHKLYSFTSTRGTSQLRNFNYIKNIEISCDGYLYFVDNKNDLYRIDGRSDLYRGDANLKVKLLSNNVINIFRSHINNIALYYTKECGTYSLSNDEEYDTITKIFHKPVSSWLKLGNYNFFVTLNGRFLEKYFVDDKYKYNDFKLKARQLSYINSKNFAILGIDGLIRIYNDEDKMYKIDIPNVDSISEDTFFTKNGDLYYFDENLNPVLMDTDVVDIGNFSRKEAFGCYVKRYI